MARILLGTTPVRITGDRSRPLIQNLGPGLVYLDTDGDVDADSGFQMKVGGVYEFPISGGDMEIFLISDTADTDVRVVDLG